MEGWIKLHRRSLDHWLYNTKKPKTRREAWEDMIMLVNYEDSKVMIRGQIYECLRGQSLRSLDSWAKQFNWSKQMVRTFFELLKTEQMIMIEGLQYTTRLTICNYEIYQQAETHEKHTKQHADNTPLTPNKKEKKEKNSRKSINLPISERTEAFVLSLAEFKDIYSKDMLNAFYRYWSEKTQDGTKMKFEMQDTWELAKRLSTWKSRQK